METFLAEIWKDILKVPSVNIEDDFFQLGGHSLLAATMINKLNESLGYNVRLSALFQAPTLGALAAVAQRQGVEQETLSTIVPIRKTGTKPALFCVSRPNVNALGFVFLSRAVSRDLPVYGLQSNMDNDGRLVPFTQQEYVEKAKEYIDAMRQVQPEGPYFLTGTCEGAHIAFEMARQLKADNLEVGILSVLDVWPVENTIDRRRYMLRSYQRAIRQFFKSSNRDRLAMIIGTLSGGPGLGAKRQVVIGGRQLRVPASDPDVKKYVQKRVQSRYWPGKDFKPTIYNGNIVVFRVATQPDHFIKDENLGWGPRVGGDVDLIRVPGTHALVLREPGVSVIGQKLEALIDEYLAKRNVSVPEPPEV
jgi:thioesterase domain-containing protein/acyl carrier protein